MGRGQDWRPRCNQEKGSEALEAQGRVLLGDPHTHRTHQPAGCGQTVRRDPSPVRGGTLAEGEQPERRLAGGHVKGCGSQ